MQAETCNRYRGCAFCRKERLIDMATQQTQLPLCAACGRPMTLTRVLEREYVGYLLQTYQCRGCRVSYTVGIPDSEELNEA